MNEVNLPGGPARRQPPEVPSPTGVQPPQLPRQDLRLFSDPQSELPSSRRGELPTGVPGPTRPISTTSGNVTSSQGSDAPLIREQSALQSKKHKINNTPRSASDPLKVIKNMISPTALTSGKARIVPPKATVQSNQASTSKSGKEPEAPDTSRHTNAQTHIVRPKSITETALRPRGPEHQPEHADLLKSLYHDDPNHPRLVRALKTPACYADIKKVLAPGYSSGREVETDRMPANARGSAKRDRKLGDRPVWNESTHQNSPPTYGDEQRLLPYVGGEAYDVFGGRTSELCFGQTSYQYGSDSIEHTVENAHIRKAPIKRFPINVRPHCDLLGAVIKGYKNSSHLLFPVDVSKDGGVFPDRVCCGLEYMPRADQRDLLLPDLTLAYDRRIGYQEHVVKSRLVDIHIFGGEGFTKQHITDDMINNWHHWFVKVGYGVRSFSIEQEPVELARRKEEDKLPKRAPLTNQGTWSGWPSGAHTVVDLVEGTSHGGSSSSMTSQDDTRSQSGDMSALGRKLANADFFADGTDKRLAKFFDGCTKLGVAVKSNGTVNLTKDQAEGIIRLTPIRGYDLDHKPSDFFACLAQSSGIHGSLLKEYVGRECSSDLVEQRGKIISALNRSFNGFIGLQNSYNKKGSTSEQQAAQAGKIFTKFDTSNELNWAGFDGQKIPETFAECLVLFYMGMNQLSSHMNQEYKIAADISGAIRRVPGPFEICAQFTKELYSETEQEAALILSEAFSKLVLTETDPDLVPQVYHLRDNWYDIQDLTTELGEYDPQDLPDVWEKGSSHRLRAWMVSAKEFVKKYVRNALPKRPLSRQGEGSRKVARTETAGTITGNQHTERLGASKVASEVILIDDDDIPEPIPTTKPAPKITKVIPRKANPDGVAYQEEQRKELAGSYDPVTLQGIKANTKWVWLSNDKFNHAISSVEAQVDLGTPVNGLMTERITAMESSVNRNIGNRIDIARRWGTWVPNTVYSEWNAPAVHPKKAKRKGRGKPK